MRKAKVGSHVKNASFVASGGGGDDAEIRKGKVKPRVIEKIYRKLIIPMTKDIEVAYLFLRCGREPPPEYASDRMSVDVATLCPGRDS